MILEKVKNTLSNFGNYYTSQFVPSSKLYFYKNFDKTYSQIIFSKNDLRINNEFTIKFNSLIIRFPFIEDLIDVRCKSKSYNEFKSLSHLIIDDYYKRLKEKNTLYITNSTNQNNTLFAQNVVNNWRRSFYLNIEIIFLFIEKNYSIQIIESINKKESSNNRLIIKPGPNDNSIKKIALKYYLIQQFYPEERLETKKYKNQKDFLEKVGLIEDVLPGSIKNHYPKIKFEQKDLVLKENKVLFNELLSENVFSYYPLCQEFLIKN
ncbi:MAG: hypothetical protein QM495_06235 [Lutibacter sp.]|uniref:hypothetical protein n=1 Tax=Lutibacter sp. TaxID=1925666 RepID=UPI00385E0046